MYAAGTCEVVRVLKGHGGIVTAMALNPRNHLQLFTASTDGTFYERERSAIAVHTTLYAAALYRLV